MSRVPRGALYAAFLLSGVTALIYQIIWSRYLMLLVGGTSVAQTIVLATFMGGLAAGNAFFGRRADRARTDRLRLYALLEVGIGLACLLYPAFFESVSRAYLSLARISGPGAAVNDVLKFLLAAASMFAPCFFMGGTLPVLAKYVVDSMSGLGGRLGFLYFINTAGAVFGCILGGFYIVEVWGPEAGMVACALVNLAIGGLFYFWSKRNAASAAQEPAGEPAPPEMTPESPYSVGQARIAFWAIAIAGSLSMLYELVWTRVLTISMGGTVHSFSTMLISFISGIAIGSALAGRLLRRPRNALVLFGLCELGIALSILVPLRYYERLPYAFYRLGSWLSHAPDTYRLYLLLQVLVAALVMVVPTTLIGAALPLASRVCVDRLDVLGRRVGGVFSVNTVGTVIGAILTGFVLLPWLGIQRTLLLGCAVSGVLGVALLWAWRPRAGGAPLRALAEALRPEPAPSGPSLWPAAAGILGVVLLAALVSSRWDPRLMQQGLFRWGGETYANWAEFRQRALNSTFLYVKDGADGTIAVQERSPVNRVVRVNGKPDASTVSDMPTQLMVGHLPMMFHPHPRTAMVVGLGSGATASAVMQHPGVEADVAEISPEMVQAARFFGPWNGDVLHNPRMKLHILDAREFLLLTAKRYDVIVSEPTNIWIPGVANLFTRDFYKVVRSRLEPGGLFAQWMQIYSAEPAMVASVIASVRQEFPYVSAWLVGDGDLILLAGDRRPEFDPDLFASRLAAVRSGMRLPAPEPPALAMFGDPVLFLSHQIGSSEAVELGWPLGTARLYYDTRPRLEFEAARAQFLGQHYRIRDNFDGRLTRLGAEPAFLEEYLARRPLDAQARARIATAMEPLGNAFRDLRAAMASALILEGDDDPALLLSLSESQLASLTVGRQLGAQIDRGVTGVAVCENYLMAEHNLLRDARSVFSRPPVDGLEARVARCATAQPELAQQLRARLAKALADAGAGDSALQQIRQLEMDGTLARIDGREASGLLVAAAVLRMESGAYDDALALARRALDLDQRNAAAARIVLSLAERRPARQPIPTLQSREPGPSDSPGAGALP